MTPPDTFTAAEVQAAIRAVIVYERQRSARLLREHARAAYSNAAAIRKAAKVDDDVLGRFLTLDELAEL